jgi:hypothetical protein
LSDLLDQLEKQVAETKRMETELDEFKTESESKAEANRISMESKDTQIADLQAQIKGMIDNMRKAVESDGQVPISHIHGVDVAIEAKVDTTEEETQTDPLEQEIIPQERKSFSDKSVKQVKKAGVEKGKRASAKKVFDQLDEPSVKESLVGGSAGHSDTVEVEQITTKKASKKKRASKVEIIAAIKLQTHLRRMASLKEIEEKREQADREKQEEAAAKLQAMARRNEVLRQKEEARQIRLEQERKEEEDRRLQEHLARVKEERDIVQVQSMVRRRQSTQVVLKLRALRFQAAANLIQKIIRGRRARKVVEGRRMEERAATKIQGLHRMRQAAVAVYLRRKEILRQEKLNKETATANHFEKMYMHGRSAPSYLRQSNCECCLCKAKELKRQEREARSKRLSRFLKTEPNKTQSKSTPKSRLKIDSLKMSTKKVTLRTFYEHDTIHWIQRQSRGTLWTRGTKNVLIKQTLKRTVSFP